jgi:carboxylate-amine ligase
MPAESAPAPPAPAPSAPAEPFTIGIEEEYQIVDPATRALRSRASRILPKAQDAVGEAAQPELFQSQLEIASPVCRTLGEVRAEVVRLRRGVIEAAAAQGAHIAAAGTHPFSHWAAQQVTDKERYHEVTDTYQQLTRELVICGCHVHVGIADREAAVAVLNRTRTWLAAFLALSANSPFWLGEDTGYASYRTALWSRFPISGPPHRFAAYAEYEASVRTLVATGTVRDGTRVYWDLRIPDRLPTLECRVADVCASVDEAVMLAALVRAVARRCHDDAVRGAPEPDLRPELLRAAHWRAARFGVDGELVDVDAGAAVPGAVRVGQLLAFARPALEDAGEWDEVAALVDEALRRGTGARRQRDAYARTGQLAGVVDQVVAETARGVTAA